SASLNDRCYINALRALFSDGDLFITMSHDMARQVSRIGCPEEKIRVIQYGVSLARFPFSPRRPPKDGPTVILLTGRLIPKKGPDDLAGAFALVCRRKRNVLLRVIGEGPLQTTMQAILCQAGVSDRVEFLGCLPPREAAAEMRRAHIFCLPSRIGP